MKFKVLRMQPSSSPLSETQLCIDGIITINTSELAQAWEMVIEHYDDEYIGSLRGTNPDIVPYKIISIHKSHHLPLIDKYGLKALLEGVKVDFVSDILDNKDDIKHVLKKEAEKISYSIIAQFERDTLFNQYNPGKLREYIENKIMDLNEKFKIESK